MSQMIDVISSEFEDALEVKNSKSLHRGIFLLLSSTIPKEEYLDGHNSLKTSIGTLNSNLELIALRMDQGFRRMDERFEAVDKRFEVVDKRFEVVDKRFESLQHQIDKRFNASDKRFESLQHQMDKRFESLQHQMDKRFDATDRRFESFGKRFEVIENRLNILSQQMNRFMIWSFSMTATASGIIIAVLKLT